MEKRKSLVEETILQIKNLEEAVAENAKGILHSTMKEEINQLVKESLTEQEGDEVEDVETDMEFSSPKSVGVGLDFDMDGEYDLTGNLGDDDMEDDEFDYESEEDEDMGDMEDEDMGDMEGEEPVIDLTEETNPEEVLRVFQLMGPNDEIIVKKNNLREYEEDEDDMMYEFEDEDEDEEFDFSDDEESDDEDVKSVIDKVFGSEMNEYEEDEDDMMYEFEEENNDDVVYEIEMEDEDEEESYELDEEYEEEEEEESYDLDSVMESKSFKAKGNVGKVKKVNFKSNTEGGFKTVKKTANKTMGTGNAKKGFTYKDGENLDGEFKIKPKKKVEAKEAARTYGNGSKSGRGLRKGITPNRNLNLESVDGVEIKILREKNEEYRKALNVFRDKLNEVAVFNSNLAYATRLFTEHTTTKQEKVNILKRFDSVETIKESKNLYHSIKNELTNTKTQPMNESIERTFNNTPSTGSAVNLIESKTYENPQFLRMKDLMTKLK